MVYYTRALMVQYPVFPTSTKVTKAVWHAANVPRLFFDQVAPKRPKRFIKNNGK